jgi:hypothetical protein
MKLSLKAYNFATPLVTPSGMGEVEILSIYTLGRLDRYIKNV